MYPWGISKLDTSNKVVLYLSHCILCAPKEIRVAKELKDFSRVKALEAMLREARQSVCLPLHLFSIIPVPNLTSLQQKTITNVVRWIIKFSKLHPSERHALKRTVRIVRSSPHCVGSVLQAVAMRPLRSTTRSTCQCSMFCSVAAQIGSPRDIDCHVALVSLSLNFAGVGNLHPNDPVPMSGKPGSAQGSMHSVLSRPLRCPTWTISCRHPFLQKRAHS